jgi:signal transduction histidine kinase
MNLRSRASRTNRIRTTLSANPLLVDTLIALGLTGLSVFLFAAGSLGPAEPLNLTLVVLQTLPLALRRRYPVAVLLVILGAGAGQLAILPVGISSFNAAVGLLVALYTVGERLERRVSFGLTVLVCAVVAASMLRLFGLQVGLGPLIQMVFFLVAAWFVGYASRFRRLYTQALEEQTRLLEREREERARIAVFEERERIARELHDAVAHHVSVVVIQAGGALRALEKRPTEARAALEAIHLTSRQALIDMRRMLGMLGEGASQEPLPGLDRLDDLLEQVRGAGLSVELVVEGSARPLDRALELSAYRIIQEALTNSLKHAGGGRARVTVRYGPRSLDISIDDERGPGATSVVEPEHDGRGIVGMRERVAMFRGTFAAQPTRIGFRVTAHLPVEEKASAV